VTGSWLLAASVAFGAIGGCAGGWTALDTGGAQTSVRVGAGVLTLCAPDAGTCDAPVVRASVEALVCVNASMLYRRGLPVPDAGAACNP
jgi:hypothetical protein